jgi:hypothetical protein
MRIWWLGLLLIAPFAACTNGPITDPSSASDAPDAAADGGETLDRDRDGVCDATEARYGGDADGSDTDRDGLPDLIELLAGFSPSEATQPGPEQVAILSGTPQAVLDFELRLTLDGSGQGYTGEFEPGTALSGDSLSASSFYTGAVALAADPRENARGIAATSERFGIVDGRTRLSFRLSFRNNEAQPANCTAGYPFLYRITADNGSLAAGRPFVLIVTSDQGSGGSPDFCMPTSCL